MSDIIITVENLSKRYMIHHQLNRGEGFRHVLQEKLTAPFRALLSRKEEGREKRLTARGAPEEGRGKREEGRDQKSEEFWALKNVSFEVKQGEVVGIIGRNGAGKSTLLKILSRITEPTEGCVRLRGRVASLLEVGTGFHPELTGRENIFLNGSILGMSKAEIRKKFDEIVAFSEVEKFLDTPVKRYSSGMYVRLAFAVAAHLEPEILIVDEVLAVGDAEFQKKCLGKMQDVAKSQGRTILFVSHNLQAVRSLCNRCLVLSGGTRKFDGETAPALDSYLAARGDVNAWHYVTASMPRRIQGSGQTRVEKVWFPSKRSRIKFNDPFRIAVELNSVGDLKGVCFDLTFFNSENNPIATSFSMKDIRLQQGVSAYELAIAPLRLAPGRYYCNFAILKGNWIHSPSIHDVVEGVLHFEVEFPEAVNGSSPVWLQGWGSSIPNDIEVRSLKTEDASN